MKKKFLPLTAEQKARGVKFSSTLVGEGMDRITHEVFYDDTQKIQRLMEDSFFDDSLCYQYNEIRTNLKKYFPNI